VRKCEYIVTTNSYKKCDIKEASIKSCFALGFSGIEDRRYPVCCQGAKIDVTEIDADGNMLEVKIWAYYSRFTS